MEEEEKEEGGERRRRKGSGGGAAGEGWVSGLFCSLVLLSSKGMAFCTVQVYIPRYIHLRHKHIEMIAGDVNVRVDLYIMTLDGFIQSKRRALSSG